jgi:hypothetical protein
MKKSFALLFTIGVVLCTLATANAEELKATVPFDFVVNGKTFPAATYNIGESLPDNTKLLAFRSDGAALFSLASAMDSSVTGTKLIFHRIGDQYFLSDVVTLDGTLHFAVSHKEAELGRSTNGSALTTIVAN